MTLRTALLATALLGAGIATPAFAQAQPAPAAPTPANTGNVPATTAPAAAAQASVTAGSPVLDANGGPVGTIASVTGDIAVIDTGVVKASVPVSSFAKSDKGLLLGMTKVELEAAAKGAQAGQQEQFLASLKPGLTVSDQNGGAVGTIEAVDADTVTVATPSAKAKLPKNALAQGANGAVIGMTRAQLEAAAKAPAPPAG